ncbi:MAG: electron transport complex subunit E [Eubacteriales bacterium]|nr:electron transport complex subunit E [Eubacteriales bacterium]MDD4078933.1 electron transport complex subunit E [Eubacteriales bacterium]MDD4768883.1 electron transport complex subunit E [Eubacteriales bacterium]
MSILKELKRGIFLENPTFRLVLGMCPTLAITTLAINGIGMGLATTAVLIGSNVVVAALKNVIPSQVRIPSYIVIISTFVTIISMLMEAYVYPLYEALGIFLPLIVVNCIILGRAEAYASKHSIGKSALDGLAIGLGFTLSLTVIGTIREILGAGSIFGYALTGENVSMATIFSLPPGAFFTLGTLMALINALTRKKSPRKKNVAAKREA